MSSFDISCDVRAPHRIISPSLAPLYASLAPLAPLYDVMLYNDL